MKSLRERKVNTQGLGKCQHLGVGQSEKHSDLIILEAEEDSRFGAT